MKPLHCRDSITLVRDSSCTFRKKYRAECRDVFRTLSNSQDVAFNKNGKRTFFSYTNGENGSYHVEQRIGGKNCYLLIPLNKNGVVT